MLTSLVPVLALPAPYCARAAAPLPAAHEMSVRSLRWRPNGDALLLIDRDSGRYCVSFLNVPGDASPGSDDAMQVGQG